MFFIPDNSPLAVDLQRALSSGGHRCNIMMVSNGEQALTILQRAKKPEASAAAPHVLLVFGGLGDGRAASLVSTLRSDPAYSEIRMVVVVGPEHQSQALPFAAFEMQRLQPLLAEPGFWWVMAKLG
jgi:hypothetical protein